VPKRYLQIPKPLIPREYILDSWNTKPYSDWCMPRGATEAYGLQKSAIRLYIRTTGWA